MRRRGRREVEGETWKPKQEAEGEGGSEGNNRRVYVCSLTHSHTHHTHRKHPKYRYVGLRV